MQDQPSRVAFRTVHNVALGYFSNYRGVSDSVRDLCTAGFGASSINISQSLAQQTRERTAGDRPLPNAVAGHSLRWLWNRIRAHDGHRRGADQMRGRNPTPAEGLNPTCSTLDLELALNAMGVPAVVIALLQKDVQQRGVFVLVDASDRVREADTILDVNAGLLRTQYLTVLPA